jgi:hypothetical protein
MNNYNMPCGKTGTTYNRLTVTFQAKSQFDLTGATIVKRVTDSKGRLIKTYAVGSGITTALPYTYYFDKIPVLDLVSDFYTFEDEITYLNADVKRYLKGNWTIE